MSGIVLDTLIQDLSDHLGLNSAQAEWDTPKKLRLLNRSFWELLNKFPFKEAEATATFSTVVGTNSYTIPADLDATQHLFYDDPIMLGRKEIILTSEITYNTNYSTQPYAQGAPALYYRLDNVINIWPSPDQIYNVIISYLAALQDLASGGVIPIPREWHEIILFGAVYRGLLSIRDYEGAAQIKNHQTSLINSMVPVEVKEQVDTRYAGLQVYNGSQTGYRRLWK